MTPPTAADPAASAARDPGSFRDPSGFVFWRDGRPYRQIQERFAPEWDAFAGSALERRLIERGRLLPYEAAPLELAPAPGAHAVIAPEPIEFVSYPYEWTFGQLSDAALLTLDAQLDALADGLDAAGRLGVQRPVPRRPPDPDRLALVRAARRRGAVGRVPPVLRALPGASRADGAARRPLGEPAPDQLDGIPLDLAASLLPWRTRAQLRPAVPRPSARPLAAPPCRRRGRAARPPSGADQPRKLVGADREPARDGRGT